MVCYKFMRAEIAIVTLSSLSLKASRPNEFNDPFECCPASDLPSIGRHLKSDPAKVRHLYELERSRGFPGSLQDFAAEGGLLDHRLNHILPQGLLASEDLGARDNASEYIGIVCLSRCSLHQLLWSHYADSHRGCAIGVDVWNPCFQRARINDRVIYAKERPTRDWCAKDRAHHRQLIEAVRTKSDVWAYEREYRIAFPLDELRKNDGKFYVNLAPEAVRRVIYGELIEASLFGQVESLLSKPEFSHVRRFSAQRDARSYQLRLRKLDPDRKGT